MDHPFEVDKEYRDRHGRYIVLSIDERNMRVRYEDGREDVVMISTAVSAWKMWAKMPEPEPPVVTKPRKRKAKKGSPKSAPVDSKQEKRIAELLQNDDVIDEILTRLVIPPGQLDFYRFFLKQPGIFFSQQELADAVRGGDLMSERSVFRAFGRRIKGSPDPDVRSLKPLYSLFFERTREGGKVEMRLRPRAIEIFKSHPKFYDFLLGDLPTWLPDEFGAPHWTNTPVVYRRQMAYFGFLDPGEEPAVD